MSLNSCMDDYRYRMSTQYTHWGFSPSNLAAIRASSNALAIRQISPRHPADVQLEYMTPDEEKRLLTFFMVELLRAGIFCELSSEIRATAAIFFKRFYVRESIMGYPPAQLMKTCLFFGAKCEGAYLRASKFAERFPNTNGEEIVAGEFVLAQGVRFSFDVRHPFRGLEAVILELKRLFPEDVSRIEAAAERARKFLRFSTLVTDVYFHYSPSQILLAALGSADPELLDRVFDSLNFGPDDEDSMLTIKERVYAVIDSCRKILETEPPERMEGYWKTEAPKEMKPLLRKLKKCRDPERADVVKVQRAKREALLAETEKKKQKKLVVADPFGPPLGA